MARGRPEQDLQIAIVDLWRIVGRADVLLHHSPNQYADTKARAGIASAMGMLPGWPDLVFLVGPSSFFMEVKAGNGALSPEQVAFRGWCWENDVPHAVVKSLSDASDIWKTWGLLRRAVSI